MRRYKVLHFIINLFFLWSYTWLNLVFDVLSILTFGLINYVTPVVNVLYDYTNLHSEIMFKLENRWHLNDDSEE